MEADNHEGAGKVTYLCYGQGLPPREVERPSWRDRQTGGSGEWSQICDSPFQLGHWFEDGSQRKDLWWHRGQNRSLSKNNGENYSLTI